MLTGQKIGNYVIHELLGSGGMGDVYAGEDYSLQRKVAIKVLKPELMGQSDVIERFKSEAVTLAKLSHPNVAAVYAFVEEENQNLLIIEFISGWDLSKLIELAGPLPIPASLYIYKQILAGVAAVHGKGMIHRDLKPSNIKITDELTAKVLDFGLARFQTADRLTRDGRLIGTLEYMSPEQIRGEDATGLSDIYSLGIILFEMVTGNLPFSGDSDYDLMKSQIESPPPSPLIFQDNIPSDLVDIILRVLSKNPTDRYQSIEELGASIDNCSVDFMNGKSMLEELTNTLALPDAQPFRRDLANGIDPSSQAGSSSGKHPAGLNSVNRVLDYSSKRIFVGLYHFFEKKVWAGPLILTLSIGTVATIFYLDKLVPNSKMSSPVEMRNQSIPPTESILPKRQEISGSVNKQQHLPEKPAGLSYQPAPRLSEKGNIIHKKDFESGLPLSDLSSVIVKRNKDKKSSANSNPKKANNMQQRGSLDNNSRKSDEEWKIRW